MDEVIKMEIGYVLIDETNRDAFERVLPRHIELEGLRVAIGAFDEEGRAVGAVSYVLLNYEYQMDWIFVEEKVRRQGVGTQLVLQVVKALMNTGDLFPLTAAFEFSTQDRALHTFFLSIKHMETSYSHDRYYVTRDDLKGSVGLHHTSSSDVVVERFFDRPEKEQKKLLQMLKMEQTYEVADYELWKKSCIPELCKCVFVKNNLVDLIFTQKCTDGNLELAYLYGKYPKGLFELLSDTVSELERLYPDADLTFEALTEESVDLAEHLFPKARKTHIYYSEF